MNNILVTGPNGQLGSEISVLAASYPQHNFFFTDVAELDITNKEATQLYVTKNNINAIINCAAYTAVDKAESEPELANNINHLAVQYLAEVAKVHHCKFIHISTDYVFDEQYFVVTTRAGSELQTIISEDTTLTNDKLWIIDNTVLIEEGVTLKMGASLKDYINSY